MSPGPKNRVTVLGAGPAGLSAAHLLSKNGVEVTVIEGDPNDVGGISRSINRDGFLFDIGPHRFFSKSAEVNALWSELLPDDLLQVERLTRIYFRKKFFAYPLQPLQTIFQLGPVTAAECVISYLAARLAPLPSPENFQDWVTNQFGNRLFELFFKTYTEKIWAMSCTQISADWATQRISGLSLKALILNSLKPGQRTGSARTLIGSFKYPRKGAGMMWSAAAERIRRHGGKFLMGQKAVALRRESDRGPWKTSVVDRSGRTLTVESEHVISSIAMNELIPSITPKLSPAAVEAAVSLRYRNVLIVALIVDASDPLSARIADNWIYIHDPNFRVGRIMNCKAFSKDLSPDSGRCCFVLEYFCSDGDELWTSDDGKLAELAKAEMTALELILPKSIQAAHVIRQPRAYPVYDHGYRDKLGLIRTALAAAAPNVQLVGRNGMHRYNNQDHAMLTGLLAAKNVLAGTLIHDLWNINDDQEYIESD